MNKPNEWDDWSEQDRQDYEYLMSIADGQLISMETLRNISEKVRGHVAGEYAQRQFEAAYNADLEDLQCGPAEAMASKQRRLCNKWCAAFKDGHCTVNRQTSEFMTVNGAAQVVNLCKLPDGLKIIDMKEHTEEPIDER